MLGSSVENVGACCFAIMTSSAIVQAGGRNGWTLKPVNSVCPYCQWTGCKTRDTDYKANKASLFCYCKYLNVSTVLVKCTLICVIIQNSNRYHLIQQVIAKLTLYHDLRLETECCANIVGASLAAQPLLDRPSVLVELMLSPVL